MAAKLVLRKCPCLRPKIEEEVRVLDYRHSSLTDVPGDVFNFERTLEELYTDSNQIRDLPRELFYCHGLRKLSISDNEITNIPPAIASLDHLEELDFSKNGIIDVPDNIKSCKYLRIIDASVNPMGKLPEGFTQLQNLTHLYLNDTFLDYLPGSFGRLVKLKILEIRENHLKTLPKSFGRLTELERLDIGNNEFTDLPDVIGSLSKLLELWCDSNQISSITHAIGGLKQLMFLDASKNELESLPGELEGCVSLADLHLSSNHLRTLPDSIGNLSNLTTLKVDDNQLTSLPRTLGGLTSLSELNVSVNDLEDLPPSIGLLRNLRTFYADENLLSFVPAELGSCSGITVLSLRSNKLTYIPDEIGRIPRLRVLNLSDNRLHHLPFTIIKLKELQALWLTENQTRPLIPLQSDYEADTGRKILTCYLLPQGHHSDNDENGDGDNDSFHASIWDEERLRRQQIHFNFADDNDDEGHLVRCPTPYPKEMREKARHMRNLAMRQSMGEGAEASGWSPHHAPHRHGGKQEKTGGAASRAGDSAADVRAHENGGNKPQSPSRQETHRLYRFDKEKQMKDKARMQHRYSNPELTDEVAFALTGRSHRPGGRGVAGSDTEDGRISGRRKSTPNLATVDGQELEQTVQRRPSYTYEDLYHKQLVHKHHHHHGRRSRRMREYDSDTGYKSDHDMQSFYRQYSSDAKDNLSVRSQPSMSRSRRHGSRREGGYASDLESYAGRGGGRWGGGASTPTPPPSSVKPGVYRLHPTHSLPQDLDARMTSETHRVSFAPQQNYTGVSSSRPSSGSNPHLAAPPSPSPLGRNSLSEQSSPASKQAAQGFPSPSQSARGRSVQFQGSGRKEGDLQRELFTVLEERKKKAAGSGTMTSSMPSPAPYREQGQPPPAHTPSHLTTTTLDPHSDPSESFSTQNSLQDSAKRGKSFSNPQYTAVHFSLPGDRAARTDPRCADHDRNYETLATVHQEDRCSGGMLPSRRTSLHQGYAEGSRTNHLRYREGGSPSCQSVEGAVGGGSQGHGEGSQGHGEGSQAGSDAASRDSHGSSSRLSGQDFPLPPPHTASPGGSQTQLYPSHHHHTAHSPAPPSYSDHNRVNYTQFSRLDSSGARCSPYPQRDLPPPARPRSGSREQDGEERSSRGSISPQKTFEGYPNPYGEPLEAGKPLMSSYEDVAMFKSVQDPSSQVSSSTDSGYGHGHHVYERIGDFSARRSGSPRSSTPPSQRDTSLRCNSSSQGTPSRETTPVKEEGFYSVHGHLLSESSCQESRDVFRSVIRKNPGLGFSIAGGQGSRGINPFRAGDMGIFVTKVQPEGPAANIIQPGDKILQVNDVDFRTIDHATAVNVLKTSSTVELLVERVQKINMV
ncbi:uncharacterized protein LOC143280209 isoform X2 [Babylonia areolata]|uniref:uncharacterized protein LOC143280209 isoform X2 n=1 Tax=Babylonia areolata TaxID=304850 RepID=UPI003FD48814